MQIFKRGIFSLIRSIILAVVGPAFLAFILYCFNLNDYIVLGIPGVLFLILIYMAFISEDIKFTIDEKGELLYYKRGKVRTTIQLPNYYCGYRSKQSDGSADYIYLNLLKIDDSEEEVCLDCTALGIMKFYKMYEVVEQYAKKQDSKLETKPKKEKLKTKKQK